MLVYLRYVFLFYPTTVDAFSELLVNYQHLHFVLSTRQKLQVVLFKQSGSCLNSVVSRMNVVCCISRDPVDQLMQFGRWVVLNPQGPVLCTWFTSPFQGFRLTLALVFAVKVMSWNQVENKLFRVLGHHDVLLFPEKTNQTLGPECPSLYSLNWMLNLLKTLKKNSNHCILRKIIYCNMKQFLLYDSSVLGVTGFPHKS